MALAVELPNSKTFIDRRNAEASLGSPNRERRQFADAHTALSFEAKELATAIDQYKLVHRRRFITYEEMLGVLQSLGYSR